MATETDIQIAIRQFREHAIAYAKNERYYKGDHDLAFASDKFTNAFGKMFRAFSMNLCPAICDAVRDKLVVDEFRIDASDKSSDAQKTQDSAWQIWTDNRMGIRASEVHKEALKNGDAYAIVWPDAKGKVTIYPNRAASCTVMYDEETPGRILWAAKHWLTNDKRYRLNMYYPDRIEKYLSEVKDPNRYPSVPEANKEATVVTSTLPTAEAFLLYDGDGSAIITNPYGIVPVFHFGNNADIGGMGFSELANAIPVQDALNKSVLDMLVAMEFSGFRQRWISGVEIEYDDAGNPIAPFKSGAGSIWMTENADAKFGDFTETNLEYFLKVKDSFRVDMACVTGTPLYYFIQTGANFPSGESLKKSETRFINKVRDRQNAFGQIWEDVMSFALLIDNKGKDVRLFTEWEDPSPMSESDELDNLIKKQTLGIPDEELWEEAGYGEEEVKEFVDAKAAAAEAAVKKFNAGELPPVPDPNATDGGSTAA